MEANSLAAINRLLEVCVGPYWEDHYTFGKVSKRTKKTFKKVHGSYVHQYHSAP